VVFRMSPQDSFGIHAKFDFSKNEFEKTTKIEPFFLIFVGCVLKICGKRTDECDTFGWLELDLVMHVCNFNAHPHGKAYICRVTAHDDKLLQLTRTLSYHHQQPLPIFVPLAEHDVRLL
jgi:hypothetical protein